MQEELTKEFFLFLSLLAPKLNNYVIVLIYILFKSNTNSEKIMTKISWLFSFFFY